ncbi:MAG TPA: hypothetical protein VJU77_14015 [Chthoniobacterales bacterium]|nr:hypothetical protein [Chthoniobacterales bacterium]
MEKFIFLTVMAGALAFGSVIGWTTYFILRRAKPTALSDLTTIIGTLGGATILGLFDAKGPMFGAYSIGLAIGFFGYYLKYSKIVGTTAIRESLIKKQGEDGTVLE